MKKRYKNLLIGASVAAGAVCAASYKIGQFVMDVALNRTLPPVMTKTKNKDKMRGSGELSAIEETLKDASSKLESSEYETIAITARDGIQMVGHLRRAQNAKRTIIAFHGWRATWARDFSLSADFWNEQGCTVLYAEQRGQGNSGGDYMAFGLLERFDCLDWIEWVNDNLTDELPIYLSGISMGATTVLMAAGLDLPANVHGITADCGYTSPPEIWKYVMEKNFHLSYGAYRGAVNAICQKKLGVKADSYSTLDAMKVCKVPVLFIHGTDDKFVPVEMTYKNYEACAAPKHLLIVPGADHGLSFVVDRPAYEKAIFEFWNRYDKP